MGSVVGEEAGYFGSKDILDPKRWTCLDRSQLHIRHRELLGRQVAILPAYGRPHRGRDRRSPTKSSDSMTSESPGHSSQRPGGSIHPLSLCVPKQVMWESGGWLDSLARCYFACSEHE